MKLLRYGATGQERPGILDSAGRIRGMLPPYVESTSYTGFNYVKDKTPYTRFGDWFPVLCATLAILGLLADRVY